MLPQVGQPGVAQAGLEGAAPGCAQHTGQQQVGAGAEPVACTLPGELLGGFRGNSLGPRRAARTRVSPGASYQCSGLQMGLAVHPRLMAGVRMHACYRHHAPHAAGQAVSHASSAAWRTAMQAHLASTTWAFVPWKAKPLMPATWRHWLPAFRLEAPEGLLGRWACTPLPEPGPRAVRRLPVM